jgi:hypothetical protein
MKYTPQGICETKRIVLLPHGNETTWDDMLQ